MITQIRNPFTAARVRDHEQINRSLAVLAAEFPYYQVGELIDCLITAQYDLDCARGLIVQATLDGVQVSEYLARIQPDGER